MGAKEGAARAGGGGLRCGFLLGRRLAEVLQYWPFLQLLLRSKHKNPPPLLSLPFIPHRQIPHLMSGIFDLQSDPPLPAVTLHLSPQQIGKNISPPLFPEPNLTKPFTGSKPNRSPASFELMRPIAIADIRCNSLAPPPPPNRSSNQSQSDKNRHTNRHAQPESRLQGIKRPHRAIHQRDQRNQRNQNRHRKAHKAKKLSLARAMPLPHRKKPLRKMRRRSPGSSYCCGCAAAHSFTALSVFSTCFSGDRLVYS